MNRLCTCGTALVLILLIAATTPLPAAFARETRPELYTAIFRDDLARARAAIAGGDDVNGVYDRDTMLCWALRGMNRDIIELILRTPGVDVNKRGVSYDSFGEWERTPLILAAHMGQAEAVSTLLRMGAKVNARDRTARTPEARGNTALIKAAQRDHTDTIRVLLTQGKGIAVDAQTTTGETPLWFVVEAEDMEATKLLHAHGARINHPDSVGRSMLVGTFLHEKYDVLDYLVANGAAIDMMDNSGLTPLMTAITLLGGDDADTVFRFLEKFITFKPKLDLQQIKTNSGGYTALHLAARFGFVDGGRLLLDNGARIDIKSLASGGTPLHSAASANQVDFAGFLLKRGAALEVFDTSGSTALILAVINADADMVRVLVESGAAIDVASPVNVLVTPLVYASMNPDPFKHKDNLAIIRCLLNNKGGIDFKSSNGTTALMAAAACSDLSNAYEKGALLVDKGADLDAVNNKGETALMLAAGAGNKKLMKRLLDNGADTLITNGAGESVMAYANRSGSTGSTALLESKGVKSSAPVVFESVIVPALVGNWKGFQDGMPHAVYTIVLGKNGRFDFNSRLTPEILKTIPKGSMNPVIAAQKGTYIINGDTMIWNIDNAPPTSMKWKLTGGMLILDSKIRLNKSR